MTSTEAPAVSRPIRLWPGVAIVAVMWLVRLVAPLIDPDWGIFGILAGIAGSLLMMVWWLFFSRVRWIDRLAMFALAVAVIVATKPLLDKSIATGAMGMLFPILALPVVSLAFVAAAALTQRATDRTRRLAMAGAIVIGCVVWTLVRTGGFTGNGKNDFAFRWSASPEDRLLTQQEVLKPLAPEPPAAVTPTPHPDPLPASGERGKTGEATLLASGERDKTGAPASGERGTSSTPAAPAERAAAPVEPATAASDWPGFRGRARDSVVQQTVRLLTDWSTKAPAQMWRRPIGPGWSSFAVRGNVLYTQEQRGEEEIVAAYLVDSGEPVWKHRDPARFWESNGGAGPRGTPTLSGRRLYTLGATGIVNALDARSGARVWSRDAAADTGAKLPMWGFSGSPLVLGDEVVVAASGSLVAYDLATGAPRWRGPKGEASYSSPQLVTVSGVPQILLLDANGLTSVSPTDGEPLWNHAWKGYPIVQPAQTAEGDVLIAVTESSGTRRLAPARGPNGWTVEERWTSNGLKPYFNDFVVHEGYAYGFDGRILSCIDLRDGSRKWKGGRYGGGQLVLLPEQHLLLVLSEEGELALVSAVPDQFRELAKAPAIDGKTWNHPVLVGDVLLVRNGEEMAAFKLPIEAP